jgi:hypothetical protein
VVVWTENDQESQSASIVWGCVNRVEQGERDDSHKVADEIDREKHAGKCRKERMRERERETLKRRMHQ